jgi:uncharacterized protein (TIGR02444 family)
MKRDDLWHFAVACYQMPGVEAACLKLQDAGADVCLLLTGAWLEGRNVACSAERLEVLTQLSADWRADVVAPLRHLRTTWREPAAGDSKLAKLRERVKALELDAERVQLERLADAAKDWSNSGGSADWLHPLSTDLAGDVRTQLEALRRAASAQLDDEGGV